MKKLAIAAGLVLAALLAAALLLPRLIDWNAYRPEIVRAAKQLTGRDIAIDGRISLALLPKPVLSATRLRLLGRDGEPELVKLAALELRIAPASLLAGELRFERLRLVGPEIAVVRDAEGRLNWSWPAPPEASGESAALVLDDVAVEGGSLSYRQSDGSERRIDDLDLTASAASLAGPFTAQGRFRAAGLPFRFAVQLGRRGADGRLAVPRLSLTLAEDGAGAGFQGQLADGRLRGKLTLQSRNLSETARRLGLPLPLPGLPLAAEARLETDGETVAVDDLAIRLAQAELDGAVQLKLGAAPRVDVALTAGLLDLDALEARGGKTGTSGAIDWSGVDALPDTLAGRLDLSFDGLALGGGMLRRIELSAALAEGVVTVDRLEAELPGDGKVGFTGHAAAGKDGPHLDGHLTLRTDNLARLLGWLRLDPGGLPAGRLLGLSLASGIALDREQLQLREARLHFDRTAATGGLTYRLHGRPAFGLDLALDRLDLDDYLPADRRLDALPLALLERFDSNLKLAADELTLGGMALGGVRLDLGLLQGQLTVREARVADLAGAALTLHASAGGLAKSPSYIGDLQLTAPEPARLLAPLGLALPAGLPPLSLDARIEGEGAAPRLQAKGRIGADAFELAGGLKRLAPEPELDLSLRAGSLPLALAARALGMAPPAALDGAAPFSLDTRLFGTPAKLNYQADLGLAGGRLHLEGRRTPDGFALTLAGEHPDAAKLLVGLGLGDVAPGAAGPAELAARIDGGGGTLRVDELTAKLGRNTLAGGFSVKTAGPRPRIEARLDVARLGPAAWPAGLFESEPGAGGRALDLLERYDGSLALNAQTLACGPAELREVSAALSLERGILSLEHLQGRLFGGDATLSGRLVGGEPAALELKLALQGADLGQASAALTGNRALSGRLDLGAELQSLGTGLPGLARGLGGSIETEAHDGTVAGLALADIGETIARAGGLDDFLAAVFGAGETRLVSVKGRWRLGDGVLATDDLRVELDGAALRLAGEVEPAARRLALAGELRPTALPGAPAIVVRLSGATAAPAAAVDAAAFWSHVSRQTASGLPPTRARRP